MASCSDMGALEMKSEDGLETPHDVLQELSQRASLPEKFSKITLDNSLRFRQDNQVRQKQQVD
jgi:hypothetical protein